MGGLLDLAYWTPMALFLTGLSLIERTWMRGPVAPREALIWALVPSLAAGAWMAWSGQAPLALFFGLWSLRAACLMLDRKACPSAELPAFRSIRAFGRETRWWVAAFLGLWLLGL